MKMPFVARTLGVVLLLSAAASAAGSVDGPWFGRAAADNADTPVFRLDLRTDGTVLTGTVMTDAKRFSIENGSAVDGNLVFDAVQPVDGGPSTLVLSCTGTLTNSADEDGIDLKCQVAGGGEKSYALKRLIGS